MSINTWRKTVFSLDQQDSRKVDEWRSLNSDYKKLLLHYTVTSNNLWTLLRIEEICICRYLIN